MLNRLKIIIEIVAILGAGIFALLTWGVDLVSKREPSWKVEIINSKAFRYREIEKTGTLESCWNSKDCKTVACKFEGSFQITNTGLRPLSLGRTKFEAFFLKREDFPNLSDKQSVFNKNLTPRSLFEVACSPDEYSECTNTKDFSTSIVPLDTSPLFPDVEAWRPYAFQVHKGDKTESFFQNHGLIIRARQEIFSRDPLLFWKENTHESTSLLYINTPCSFGAELKPIQKKQ